MTLSQTLLEMYGGEMINYDPKDSAIQLYDSLYIIHEHDASALDITKLEDDIVADIEIVINQARQACACDEELKVEMKSRKSIVTLKDEDEVCLPCQARAALNAIRGVAENG